MIKLNECADAVSSIDKEHTEKWREGGTEFWPIHMPLITFDDICNYFGWSFDFINIDLEGVSMHVLMQVLEYYKNGGGPKVIFVEHDGNDKEISNRAREFGYSPCYLDGNNLGLAR